MQCSLRDQILQQDQRTPRYTSYPTAPHFTDIRRPETYTDTLHALPNGSKLSLYLHVPFCPKLCWYCGCNTKITKRYAPVEDYVHLLMREIDILANKLNGTHTVHNVHFGGGSPGLLHGNDFGLIMEKLGEHFNVSTQANISIELDPRGVTHDRVEAYAKNGVNRVSLGVQDFDDTVLSAVNRQQPFELSTNAVALLREHGIYNLNIDLMYGLPHQTLEGHVKTLEKAIELNPSRIAFFGYAHVPWMKKHMRLIDDGHLPGKDLRYDLYEQGHRFFVEHGYEAIGIDHFVKPEDSLNNAYRDKTMKRNFQGYTDDQAEVLIGLGVSSIGKTHSAYFQNHPDMPSYKNSILAEQLPVKKSYEMNADDQLRADVIEQLMCYLHVDTSTILSAHDYEADTFNTEFDLLKSYETLGFIEINGASIVIKPEARLMVRIICGVFDANLARRTFEETPRHSQAI